MVKGETPIHLHLHLHLHMQSIPQPKRLALRTMMELIPHFQSCCHDKSCRLTDDSSELRICKQPPCEILVAVANLTPSQIMSALPNVQISKAGLRTCTGGKATRSYTRQRLNEIIENSIMNVTLETLKAQTEKLVYAATSRLGNAQGVIMYDNFLHNFLAFFC